MAAAAAGDDSGGEVTFKFSSNGSVVSVNGAPVEDTAAVTAAAELEASVENAAVEAAAAARETQAAAAAAAVRLAGVAASAAAAAVDAVAAAVAPAQPQQPSEPSQQPPQPQQQPEQQQPQSSGWAAASTSNPAAAAAGAATSAALAAAKLALLERAAPLNRGALATAVDRAEVDDLIRALEAAGGLAAAGSSSSGGGGGGGGPAALLDGRWELVYANTEAFRNSPFFGAFANVVSGLAADDGTVADAIFAFTGERRLVHCFWTCV